jgi:hypothetical protein
MKRVTLYAALGGGVGFTSLLVGRWCCPSSIVIVLLESGIGSIVRLRPACSYRRYFCTLIRHHYEIGATFIARNKCKDVRHSIRYIVRAGARTLKN